MKKEAVKEKAKITTVKNLTEVENELVLDEITLLLTNEEHLVICFKSARTNVVLTNLRILVYSSREVTSYKYSALTTFSLNKAKKMFDLYFYGATPLKLYIRSKNLMYIYRCISDYSI